MKVVILCGGQGTRLQEATGGIKPKPMVEIGGRPLLWHIMKIYSSFGHNEFVLCLGHLGYIIKDYFLHYEAINSDITLDLGAQGEIVYHRIHNERDWKVTLSNTGLASMTGSRIARIEQYVKGETFMLTYGDGVSDIDLEKLLEFHKSHGKTATVTGVNPVGRFGRMDTQGKAVVSFQEKPLGDGRGKVNGGFFIFEPEIFNYVSKDPDCIFEREPLEKLAQDGELMMYTHDGFWECVDTYRDLVSLQDAWNQGNPVWKNWSDK